MLLRNMKQIYKIIGFFLLVSCGSNETESADHTISPKNKEIVRYDSMVTEIEIQEKKPVSATKDRTSDVLEMESTSVFTDSCGDKITLIKISEDDIGLESVENYQDCMKVLEAEEIIVKLMDLRNKIQPTTLYSRQMAE